MATEKIKPNVRTGDIFNAFHLPLRLRVHLTLSANKSGVNHNPGPVGVTKTDLNQWGAKFRNPAIFVSLVEWSDRKTRRGADFICRDYPVLRKNSMDDIVAQMFSSLNTIAKSAPFPVR
jgi:hypothetical protein